MFDWLLSKIGLGGVVSSVTGLDLGPWLDVIVQLVGTFALIATLTQTTADNKVADILVKVVHFLGGNFGKAKNAGSS